MADLTNLTDVRLFLQKPAADTGQDAAISALIPRVTAAIQAWTRREFIPTSSATRRFIWAGGPLSLAPFDLRTVTTLTFDVDTTTPTVAATTDYQLRPFSAASATYGWLVFSTVPDVPSWTGNWGQTIPGLNATTYPAQIPPRVVEIAGAWGFATVPADVAQAAIFTVKEWLEAVNTFNPGLVEDLGAGDSTPGYVAALPYSARMLLSPYRRAALPI